MDTKPIVDTSSAQIYTDLNGIQQLKAQSKGGDKAAALKNVAQQFESMMVQMMMKSMRDANAVFAEGDMTSSSDEKFYRDMFDNQLALTLSKGRGFGIADAILRQLQGRAGIDTNAAQSNSLQPLTRAGVNPNAAVHAALSAENANDNRSLNSPLAPPDSAIQETIHRLFGADITLANAAEQRSENVAIDGTPQNFVERLAPMAQRVGEKLGIDSRVLLSQSALETGWGQKVLQCPDGSSSFNFFNIKADASWTGAVVKVPVIEYQNGVAVREWANFRAYSSPEESFTDYAKFISDNPRYQQALACGDDPRAYVKALADAGYATDPRYAQKVLAVFDSEHVQSAGRIQ